jgi:hypothetical protein
VAKRQNTLLKSQIATSKKKKGGVISQIVISKAGRVGKAKTAARESCTFGLDPAKTGPLRRTMLRQVSAKAAFAKYSPPRFLPFMANAIFPASETS